MVKFCPIESEFNTLIGGLAIKTTFAFALCLALGVFGFSLPAYAYLDPGTGSMVLQAILGTLAAGAAIAGIYWAKVKAFFARKGHSVAGPQGAQEDSG